MPANASTALRCPKCRVRDLHLHEINEWVTTFTVTAGRLDRREGYHEPGGYVRLEAECRRCGHHWKVRGAIQITDVVTEDELQENS